MNSYEDTKPTHSPALQSAVEDEEEDQDEEGAQYATPMNDPFAEVESGWRRMSECTGYESTTMRARLENKKKKKKQNEISIDTTSSTTTTTTTTLPLPPPPPAPILTMSTQARRPPVSLSDLTPPPSSSVLTHNLSNDIHRWPLPLLQPTPPHHDHHPTTKAGAEGLQPINDEVLDQLSGFSFTPHNSNDNNNSIQPQQLPDHHYHHPQSRPPPIELLSPPSSSKPHSYRQLSVPPTNPDLVNGFHHQPQSPGPIYPSATISRPRPINLNNLSKPDSAIDLPPLPPLSALSSKISFSSADLSLRPLPHSQVQHQSSLIGSSQNTRNRFASFPSELEPISGSPTSPNSPCPPPPPPPSLSNSTVHTRRSVSGRMAVTLNHLGQQHYQPISSPLTSKPAPPSSSSSLPSSSEDTLLLRRASSSSLTSVGSVTSTGTNGLKARRGLTKPLSLALPVSNHLGNTLASFDSTITCTPTTTGLPAITPDPNQTRSQQAASRTMASSRSLPPSPRASNSSELEHSRDQIVGMKANVTGGLSMKRRTSIPRLSLSGISSSSLSSSNRFSHLPPPPVLPSLLPSIGSQQPIQMIGRNIENCLPTPNRLHFDPIAANEGRHELLSSQVGTGGKGHIERPDDATELFPYQLGPREVLSGVYLGSEQNARDETLLNRMGFGLIVNVAKEVECPWEPKPAPDARIEQGQKAKQQAVGRSHQGRDLLIRPTASTPNLKRSFEGKIRVKPGATRAVAKDDKMQGVSEEDEEMRDLPGNQQNTTIKSKSRGNSGKKATLNGERRRLIHVRRFAMDEESGRPELDYVKLDWTHDQDGLSGVFESNEVFEVIDKARSRGVKTLIHCQCGVSRSATLMIGYCMRESGVGRMHEAYSFVKEKSPWAGPNMGLIYQLIEYEKVLMKNNKGDHEIEEDDEDDDGLESDQDDEEEQPPQSYSKEVIVEEGLRTPTMMFE